METFGRKCAYEEVKQRIKYRAIIKKSDGWWIGWLVDLPEVNAQERTKEELLKSLAIGAQESSISLVLSALCKFWLIIRHPFTQEYCCLTFLI